jgi:hypothetical protein
MDALPGTESENERGIGNIVNAPLRRTAAGQGFTTRVKGNLW